jgi:hypothetical protein
MKKLTKSGKIVFFMGMWIFAFGFAFKLIVAPEPYLSFSMPLLIIGILLIIASIFFKEIRKSET